MAQDLSKKKGFTLIELLVVIAIIAIIAVVIVLILNPSQLLMESRDSNRVSDMSSLKNALSVYTAQGGTSMGSASMVYISVPDPSATSTAGDQCQGLTISSLPNGYAYHCASSSTYRNTDGTGWIPVALNQIPTGSPISQLPVDPTNQSSSALYYTYETDGTRFELTAVMESSKYKSGGSNDEVSTDGGQYSDLYETGTNLALAPVDLNSNTINIILTNVAAARAFTTVYQNTSSNALFVSVADTGTGKTWALVGSSSPPAAEVAQFTNTNNTFNRNIFFPVPAGDYYEVTNDTSANITLWYEWNVSKIAIGQPTNVGGSRVLKTVYQNTTGNAIFVSAVDHPGGTGSTWGMTNTSTPPGTYIAEVSSIVNYERPLFFPVANNYYYEVSYDTGTTLDSWFEWSLTNTTPVQNIVTGSLALNTIYQNTTGYPLIVSAQDNSTSMNGSTWALIGSSSPPGIQVANVSGQSGFARELMFIVPQNYYYEVTYDNASVLDNWADWGLE